MLYSEFLDGVGCPDRPRNYEVYKSLESIYMNDETLSKEAIYNAGKSLVEMPKSQESSDQAEEENMTLKEVIAFLSKPSVFGGKFEYYNYKVIVMDIDTGEISADGYFYNPVILLSLFGNFKVKDTNMSAEEEYFIFTLIDEF